MNKSVSGFFSRVVMATCTLPATFFYYQNLGEWAAATTRGPAFFSNVLNNPEPIRKRLNGKPWLVNMLVSLGVTIAQRIRRNGGVVPSVRNMYCIFNAEGIRGIYLRLTDHLPERNRVADRTPPNPNRVLVADYRIPRSDVSAGERATEGILRDLRLLGYDVVFLPNDLAPSPKYEKKLKEIGVSVITRAQGYRSSVHYLSREGHTFGVFYLIRVDVAETMLDVVRQVAPAARVIFHAPDLYSLREMREANLRNSSLMRARAKRTRERELSVISRVDYVVLVSPSEVPHLKELLPDAAVGVFPALYTPVATVPALFEKRENLFFLGGFTHKPNVDAVLWFVEEIWPLVRKRLPEVEFHIIGSEAPSSILELHRVPGVRLIGFVPDLDPVLGAYRVGVAPLRFGAGIKGKVATAMGAGVPCVCTGIAAEGMDMQAGVHTLLADMPQAFADAITTLYTDADLWAKLSVNGRELVRRSFSDEANRSSLLSVLNAARALPVSLFAAHCKALPPRAVPVPPAGTAVDVSIIIPVHNQWSFTRTCLNSILETCQGNDSHFELILADDCSSDETLRAGELYPGLKVVKTETNLGFLRNCNNAARHARGRYIILLNNDTVVMPGWLTNLYRTLERDSSVAIAGSKLLYPNGFIQEAGCVLFNDGTAHNVGRWSNRDAPIFNIAREVDYISGASIMVRKTFWDQVGGFDDLYKNAYCEDSDLAMSARLSGMRVIYQPASEVLHFERQSYTNQVNPCRNTLQAHNTGLLLNKWHDAFQREHLPASTPWHISMSLAEKTVPPTALERRRKGRFNILYFSPFPSHPSNHGNQTTIQQFGQRFQNMGHKVHFALLQSALLTEEDVADMRACWDSLDILRSSCPLEANGNPIPFDGWYQEGLGEQIRVLCTKHEIDTVFCSYIFQSKLLEYVPAHILKIIDTHDKMGNRYEMLRANGLQPEFFSCTPEEEGAYLRRGDLVVARREEEARYFNEMSGRQTALVIPHVEEPKFLERRFSYVKHVGVVASANRINLTMLREFLEALDRRSPERAYPFVIHVAGQVKDMVASLPARDQGLFKRPWVRMHGFVPDIGGFYAGMDVILAPVTIGTGINVKSVQAMAFGMPLLTTKCGSKGIETGDYRHGSPDMDSLVTNLLALVENPAELQTLAAISRDRYTLFYRDSMRAIAALFNHPKLTRI